MNARRPIALAAALLLALAGCSDRSQPLMSSAPVQAGAVLGGTLSLTGVLQFVGMPDLTGTRSTSKRIVAAEGGFVELNGFRVDIPAGALPADTTVTITLPGDNVLAKRLVAEFEPHGVQFNTPVTLTFPLTGVLWSGAGIEVARWENGAWTSLGGSVNLLGTKLTGQTPHFSTYGGKYILAGG
ncbi:hypothetical protein [Longimicrobium sp.]|uniref:hypothetical protein n=1 Tax=Longimicrobium sp. TaxID=2029185 RepID=UPI002E37CBFA|nr:hypothetical protein [Longimicrobium sp.]HEX6041443.1 hypothetical protein [Longimicrobium sp.]